MWGWVAGTVALVAIVAAAFNLDYIKKTDTYAYVSNQLHVSDNDNAGGATISLMGDVSSSFKLVSSAFADGDSIPSRFTCDALPVGGTPHNPPLSITGIPEGTRSLALIVDDPDVPKALRPEGVFDHWVLFNMPATTTAIGEGEVPGVQGANGSGVAAYAPPCPPPQYEPSEHRYVFKFYALDAMLSLPAGAGKAQVEAAMEGHVLAQAQLIGTYKRK